MLVKDLLFRESIKPQLDGKEVSPIRFGQRAIIEFPQIPFNLLIREVIKDVTEDADGDPDIGIDEHLVIIDWLMENSNLNELRSCVWTEQHAQYTLLRRTLRNIAHSYPLMREAVVKLVVEKYPPNLVRPIVMPDGFELLSDEAVVTYEEDERQHQLQLLPLVLHAQTDFDLYQSFGYGENDMRLIRAHCYRMIAKAHPYLYRIAMAEAQKLDPRTY